MAIEVVPTEAAVASACHFLGVRPEFIRAITRDVQVLVPKDSGVLLDLSMPVFTFKFDMVSAAPSANENPTDPHVSFAAVIHTYFGTPATDLWGRDHGIQVGKFSSVRAKEDYANILKHYAAALKVAAANTKAERYRSPERKAYRDKRAAEFDQIAAEVEAVAQAILDGKYDAEWEGSNK